MVTAKPVRAAIYFVFVVLILLVLFHKRRDDSTAVRVGSEQSDRVAIALEEKIPVREGVPFDAKIAYHNIINETPFSPVVIFSKTHCPHSRAAKQLLTETYTLQPPPRIVELDLHPNGAELQDYIAGVTGQRTVPNVIILKESHGGNDAMRALHESGELPAKFEEWSRGSVRASKN